MVAKLFKTGTEAIATTIGATCVFAAAPAFGGAVAVIIGAAKLWDYFNGNKTPFGKKSKSIDAAINAALKDARMGMKAQFSGHADIEAELIRIENNFRDKLPDCRFEIAHIADAARNPKGFANSLAADIMDALSQIDEEFHHSRKDELPYIYICSALKAGYEAVVLEPDNFKAIEPKILIDMTAKMAENHTQIMDALAALDAKVEKLAVAMTDQAREFGIKEGLLIALARRYAQGSHGDFDEALAGLEHALNVAHNERERDKLPSNTEAAVDTVITRIDELNDLGDLDAGQAALDAELLAMDEEDECRNAARSRLYEKGVAQAILSRSVENAYRFLVAQIELVRPLTPDERYNTLGLLFTEWRQVGSEKGLSFELEVAIALARRMIEEGQNAWQRGAGFNFLGMALATLGDRSVDDMLLREAVAAFRLATEEHTLDRSPPSWATTQNNLGNALQALFDRTLDDDLLQEAISTYRLALEVQDRNTFPLDWAITQNNLGNSLSKLGERSSDHRCFEKSITAYRLALEVWSHDSEPLNWASAQNNLSGVLAIVGARSSDDALLQEAIDAGHLALQVRTRNRFPLDWAMTQYNLGATYGIFAYKNRDKDGVIKAIKAFKLALKEFRQDNSPYQYKLTLQNIATSERHLADIRAEKSTE